MSFRLVGIGEVLWDLLPAGPQLGGAPANFAYHAHALGATASLVTRVGKDDRGKAILERFEQIEIADDTIQVDDDAPTGTVTVALSHTAFHTTSFTNMWPGITWRRPHRRSRPFARRMRSVLAASPSEAESRGMPSRRWWPPPRRRRCGCLTSMCARTISRAM